MSWTKTREILKENIIPFNMFIRMVCIGILMCVTTLMIFNYYLTLGTGSFILNLGLETYKKATTMAFTIMVVFELFNVFCCRSENGSIFSIKRQNIILWIAVISSFVLQLMVLYVGPIQIAFRTTELNITDWIIVFLVSSSVVLLTEIYKFFIRRGISVKQKKLAKKSHETEILNN